MLVDRVEKHRIPKEIALGLATLGAAGMAIVAAFESIQIREGYSLPSVHLSTGAGDVEINEFGVYGVFLEPCPPKSLRGAKTRVYARELIVGFPSWMRWNLPYSGNMRSPSRLKDYRGCLTPN